MLTKVRGWVVVIGFILIVSGAGVAAGYGGYALARSRQEAADTAAFIQRLKAAEPVLSEIVATWQQAQQQRQQQLAAARQAQQSSQQPQQQPQQSQESPAPPTK